MFQAVSKKFEPVAIDVYELFDFRCCETGAERFASWIGEKLLACRLVNVDSGEKNFKP
jgi:hypothetical protein